MSSPVHVFLVPGFFGFQVLAGLPYFFGVRELLRDALAAQGIAARVHALDTLPTASLEQRARYLADKLLAIVSRDGSPVHIIGHSTGGLDARVLLSRDGPLTGLHELDGLRSRVRSLVTVSTPHHGTPLAELLVRVEGQKLLRLVGLLGVHGLRYAGRPLVSALALGRLLGRLDELVLLRESALDRAYSLLVDPLSRDRLAPVEGFAAAVRQDQTLIRQLWPSAMAGFSEHYRLDPRIRQGCVLTRARPPSMRAACSRSPSSVRSRSCRISSRRRSSSDVRKRVGATATAAGPKTSRRWPTSSAGSSRPGARARASRA